MRWGADAKVDQRTDLWAGAAVRRQCRQRRRAAPVVGVRVCGSASGRRRRACAGRRGTAAGAGAAAAPLRRLTRRFISCPARREASRAPRPTTCTGRPTGSPTSIPPTVPPIVAVGRRDAAINACGLCHYIGGAGRQENAGLAGLPYRVLRADDAGLQERQAAQRRPAQGEHQPHDPVCQGDDRRGDRSVGPVLQLHAMEAADPRGGDAHGAEDAHAVWRLLPAAR